MLSWTIILSLLANHFTKGQQCDLNCPANSTCISGVADFSKHPQPNGVPLSFLQVNASKNGYHCQCPVGRTGLLCARKYQTCGNHTCYHGGSCLAGLEDQYGDNELFCDCSTAIAGNGVSYVGKYCEIPKPQPCGSDDQVFCVNGGTCKSQFQEYPQRPCHCGSDYDGPHCEFTKGAVPDCTLQCENGGECQLGIKTYSEAENAYMSFWQNTTSSYQHCLCPPGYFGLTCETKGTQCGNHHCFNGATCLEKVGYEGSTKQRCDCTSAQTNTTSYAGQYCQYEADSYCAGSGGENGHAFCVNGGKCKSHASLFGCDCPDGFSGPICEIHASEKQNPDMAKCKLECENYGHCREGAKDISFLSKFGAVSKELNVTHNGDFEHCVCPTGYVGLQCNVTVETCGDSKHVCLYGSTCIQNGDEYSCDCTSADTSHTKFAGESCQLMSTQICTPDGQVGVGANSMAFCVNNGECKGLSDSHESHKGCNCPDGFTGAQCHISVTSESAVNSEETGYNGKVGKVTGSIVTIVACAVLGAVLFVGSRKKNQRTMDISMSVETSSPLPGYSSAFSVLDMEPDKDDDGNDFETVEIL